MSLVKMTFLGCIVGFWFSCHVHTPAENTNNLQKLFFVVVFLMLLWLDLLIIQ